MRGKRAAATLPLTSPVHTSHPEGLPSQRTWTSVWYVAMGLKLLSGRLLSSDSWKVTVDGCASPLQHGQRLW